MGKTPVFLQLPEGAELGTGQASEDGQESHVTSSGAEARQSVMGGNPTSIARAEPPVGPSKMGCSKYKTSSIQDRKPGAVQHGSESMSPHGELCRSLSPS